MKLPCFSHIGYYCTRDKWLHSLITNGRLLIHCSIHYINILQQDKMKILFSLQEKVVIAILVYHLKHSLFPNNNSLDLKWNWGIHRSYKGSFHNFMYTFAYVGNKLTSTFCHFHRAFKWSEQESKGKSIAWESFESLCLQFLKKCPGILWLQGPAPRDQFFSFNNLSK